MPVELAMPNPTTPKAAKVGKGEMTSDEVVTVLEGYRQEAENARKTGPAARDDKWQENLDLYWNRYDHSKKASWQAKEAMPEVPVFVDRFAAALKEALNATPKGFYSVEDDTDSEGDLANAVQRMMDVWLMRVGQNQVGQIMDFSGVFEEQMKLGALMATSALVTWKRDVPGGRVAMETTDPRSVWLDHTGRNLYRVREIEIDKHDLLKLAKMKDGKGRPLYDQEAVLNLVTSVSEDMRRDREALTGVGQEITSNRAPVVLHEYMATILGPDGKLVSDQGLCVVANGKHLIRGPEANPFWHGKDWVLHSPLIPVPFSPYGRSYMEDLGSVAKTFNELTNLILDAVTVSSMKSFVMQPELLLNPAQVDGGMSPFKIWKLEQGASAKDFLAEVDLGTLDQGALTVWNVLKNELTEAAGQNEVGLGQFAPNSRTSATEIMESQQGRGTMIQSVAANVENRFLNPALDLIWKTGLQHVSRNDPAMRAAVGEEMWRVLHARRKELVARPITFAARGISTLLYKGRKLKALMNALQIIASSDVLLREFLQAVDPKKLTTLILDLLDLDLTKLEITERERLIRQMTEGVGQAQQGAQQRSAGQEAGGAANIAQQAAQTLGVG